MYTIYENKGLVTLEIAENVAKEKRLPQHVIFNDKFDLACYVIKHGLTKDYNEEKILTIINSKLINTLFKNGLVYKPDVSSILDSSRFNPTPLKHNLNLSRTEIVEMNIIEVNDDDNE